MMLAKFSLSPNRHADLERDNDSDQQRHQRQRNILPAPQRDKQDQRDRASATRRRPEEMLYDGCGRLDMKTGGRLASGATLRNGRRRSDAGRRCRSRRRLASTSIRTSPSVGLQAFLSAAEACRWSRARRRGDPRLAKRSPERRDQRALCLLSGRPAAPSRRLQRPSPGGAPAPRQGCQVADYVI